MKKSIKLLLLIFLMPIIVIGQLGLDTDGDGVIDDFDKDSDNDGILDINECRQSNYFWSSDPDVDGKTATGTINGINYTYTSNFDIVTSLLFRAGTFPREFTIPSVNVIQNTLASNNVLVFDTPIKNPVLAFASIGRAETPVPIEFQQEIEVLFSEGVTVVSDTEVIGEEGFLVVRLNGIYSEIEFDYLADEFYVNFAFGADFPIYCDTDGDGIYDYLDFDSDNDGCLDAIEGGGGFIRTDISGTMLSGPVDDDGIPISAGSAGQDTGTSRLATITNPECIEDYGLADTLNLCLGETGVITSNTGVGEWVGSQPYVEVSPTQIDVTPLESTVYYFGDRIIRLSGTNLFANPDFEAGGAFTTDFNENCSLTSDLADGEFCVSSSPTALNSTWSSCSDNTVAGGNLLIVNGDNVLNKKIICRDIPVEENTNYEISTMLTSVSSTNPASIGFMINNIDVGAAFSPDPVDCNWTTFTEYWNSASETSAEVCLVNKNTTLGGNDFALDNITFSKSRVMGGTADSTVVIVHNYPNVNLGEDTFICPDSEQTLDAEYPSSSYLWSTTETTPSITISTAGTYFVEVTSEYGCKSYDTVEIALGYAPPVFDLGDDITICSGEDTTLFSPTDTIDINWSTGSTDTSIEINTSGEFKLTLIGSNGCSVSDSLELTVNPVPNILLDTSYALCYQQPFVLDAGNVGFNYDWSTGANTQEITINSLGNYTLRVFDDHGCDDSISINVFGDTIPDPFSEKDLWYCQGDSIVLQPDSGYSTYSIMWIDGPRSSTQTVSFPGTYQATVNSLYCADTFEINVTEISTDVALVDLGGKSSYCFNFEGTELILVGEDLSLMTIDWAFDRSSSVSKPVDSAGVYQVTVSNEFCSFDLQIELRDYCSALLFTPNAFTPNDDGRNDVFYPVSNGYILDYRMDIFDRWGMNIFTTNNFGVGWDGTFNNRPAQQDVYVYRIVYSFENENGILDEKVLLGRVSLIH